MSIALEKSRRGGGGNVKSVESLKDSCIVKYAAFDTATRDVVIISLVKIQRQFDSADGSRETFIKHEEPFLPWSIQTSY